jgi:Tol biopolymer transport system component
MKKLLVFVPVCLLMMWGCASIVYVSQETGRGQLMTSTDEVPLQPSALFVTAFDDSMPDVSRDGKWVAFRRVIGGFDRIIVRQVGDAAGTTEKNLAQGLRPRWSPAGDWILFRNLGKIYRIRPDGTSLTQVTTPPAGVTDIFGHDYWNASTIVFGRGTGTGPGQTVGIYLQDIATATVTGPILAGSQPVVSHDGSLLVSEVKIPTGPALLHFININRIPTLQFVNRIGFAYGPNSTSVQNVSGIAFSADDKRLLFSAIPPNETKREIYSMKVDDTTGLTQRLLTNAWDDLYPDGYKPELF